MLNRLLVYTIILGLMPLGASLWWVLELSSHFRLQYVALALAMLVVASFRRGRALALALGTVIVINLWPLLPYLPLAADAESGPTITLLNVNVNSDNREFDAILDLIRKSSADIVTLIELTPELDRRLEALADDYPFRVTRPDTGHFGLGILSKYPLLDSDTLDLGPTQAVIGVVDSPLQPLGVLAVHPVPPISAAMAATRNTQLGELASIVSTVTGPLVVCGDFNLSPYSPFFSRFLADSRMKDTRRGHGIGFSWPSFMPLLGIPIDQCFTSDGLQSSSVERLARFGSDHYPVRVRLFARDPS